MSRKRLNSLSTTLKCPLKGSKENGNKSRCK